MSFGQFVPVAKADYDRWKRIKAQYQDYNPAISEAANLQQQIAEIGQENSLTIAEKFKIIDNLQMRINSIRKSFPTTYAAALLPEKDVSSPELTPGAEPKRPAVPTLPPAVVPAAPTAEVSPLRGDEQIDISDYAKIREYFGSAKNLGVDKHSELYKHALSFISDNSDRIGINKKREIVLDGEVIKNSTAQDLVKLLFVERKSANSVGLDRFLNVLYDTGAPNTLFVSKRVKQRLGLIRGGYPLQTPASRVRAMAKKARKEDTPSTPSSDTEVDLTNLSFGTPETSVRKEIPSIKQQRALKSGVKGKAMMTGKGLKIISLKPPPGKLDKPRIIKLTVAKKAHCGQSIPKALCAKLQSSNGVLRLYH